MTQTLPRIDIAPLADADAAAHTDVVRRLGAACRSVGFFAITDHGVPQALRDGTFAAAAAFFAQPLAAKQPLARGLHGPNRGYVGLGTEALDEKALPDLKEAFNIVWTDGESGAASRPPNVWPALPGWRDTVQAYFDAVLEVGRRLHRAFALDLGADAHFFDDKLDRPLATLRLLRYPARFDAGTPRGQAGAGTHTDYGNVTLLATDNVPGLQVQRRGGGWIDVPSMPDAFVCNIGDCLMRWSNDVYVSTPHRVLAPARERLSIAFFLDANPDALVSALPSCVPAGTAPRHAPVTVAEHLQQRFDATYGA
jgi:isopenicillin N synthase-like dioxygenase